MQMNVEKNQVVQQVISYEVALLDAAVRSNAEELTRLLHPDFMEVGQSGHSFNREEMITALLAETASESAILYQDFIGHCIDANTILLTYQTAIKSGAQVARIAKRSSVWVNTGSRWQIRYHQGTPCDLSSALNWNSSL